jgi:hypothetical protein
MSLSLSVLAQEYTEIRGKIVDKQTKKPVSYAHIQHKTLHLITQANNDGDFVFKIPNAFAEGSIIVSCVSYEKRTIAIKDVIKQQKIELKPDPTQLQSITINALPTANSILDSVKKHIVDNYYTDTTINTFFYREYRIVDGNMYLFDEAIFDLLRRGAGKDKRHILIKFSDNQKWTKSNYKQVQKYRLLVYDTLAIDSLAFLASDKESLIKYYEDNFSDITEFPNSAYILGYKKSFTSTVSKYMDVDSNQFYRIVMTPKPNKRFVDELENIEVIVNAKDYALINVSHSYDKRMYFSPLSKNRKWAKKVINAYFNSAYSKVGDKYTLTNSESFANSLYYDEAERPHNITSSSSFSLTGFEKDKASITSFMERGEVLKTKPQKYDRVFTNSEYDEGFWQQYNFVPLDTDIYRKLKATLNRKK